MAAEAWIVRAGRDDEYAALALERGIVGLAWHRVGDLTDATTARAVRSRVAETYPDEPAAVRTLYALQLHAFRTAVRPGHLVVLLRRHSPEVAVGEITGDYRYEPGPGPAHVRTVNWLKPRLRRAELGPTVLAVPALAAVVRVTRPADRARVADAASGIVPTAEAAVRPAGQSASEESAADGLRRNLDHARNLADAGSHLEALGVTSFEFRDVYRAAWAQAVASLDHWAGREVAARTQVLLARPTDSWPRTFGRVVAGREYGRARDAGPEALRRVIEKQLDRGRTVYQSPATISQAFEDVTEITDLWTRVGAVLVPPLDGGKVAEMLTGTVQRRHQIVHRYDEDPANPPYKRAVDLASTMAAIDLIDQVTAGILLVIDGK